MQQQWQESINYTGQWSVIKLLYSYKKFAIEKAIEIPIENVIEKAIEIVIENAIDYMLWSIDMAWFIVIEKAIEKPIEIVIEKPIERAIEKVIDTLN